MVAEPVSAEPAPDSGADGGAGGAQRRPRGARADRHDPRRGSAGCRERPRAERRGVRPGECPVCRRLPARSAHPSALPAGDPRDRHGGRRVARSDPRPGSPGPAGVAGDVAAPGPPSGSALGGWALRAGDPALPADRDGPAGTSPPGATGASRRRTARTSPSAAGDAAAPSRAFPAPPPRVAAGDAPRHRGARLHPRILRGLLHRRESAQAVWPGGGGDRAPRDPHLRRPTPLVPGRDRAAVRPAGPGAPHPGAESPAHSRARRGDPRPEPPDPPPGARAGLRSGLWPPGVGGAVLPGGRPGVPTPGALFHARAPAGSRPASPGGCRLPDGDGPPARRARRLHPGGGAPHRQRAPREAHPRDRPPDARGVRADRSGGAPLHHGCRGGGPAPGSPDGPPVGGAPQLRPPRPASP